MSETPIGSTAAGNLSNGHTSGNSCTRIRTSGGDSLLEELRTAYQRLGHEERRQVKSLMLTLSTCDSDLLRRKESTHRRDTYGKQLLNFRQHAEVEQE